MADAASPPPLDPAALDPTALDPTALQPWPPGPPTVRLDQPGELAAALPHLLGFRPVESVVAVSLRGRPGRPARGGQVGLTARMDLPTAAARRVVVSQLVGAMLTDRPAAVVLAVVSEAADETGLAVTAGRGGPADLRVAELPHRSLVGESVLGFAEHGVPVLDALLVRRGRWWSYDCAEDCCRPGSGTPLPAGTSALAAASAVAGQVVEADRAALERRIAPVGFLAAAGMAQAGDEVGAELAARAEVVGPVVVAEESWVLLQEAVTAVAPGAGGALSDRQVARLAWGLLDLGVRDRAMGLAVGLPSETAARRAGGPGPGPSAAEVLWTELTRRAPTPLEAAPATLLAVTAWVRGDGALANVALDRALASRPAYRMAQLLRAALDAALPPADVRRLVRDGLRSGLGQ